MTSFNIYNPGFSDLIREYFTSGKSFASALATSVMESINIPILTSLPIIGGGIGGALLSFVLVMGLLFACFKLFFALLMCYIQIILSLITSPIKIMLSAIPGRGEGTFGGWLKDLLSNILVFPTVISIFLLADALKQLTEKSTQPMWSPPFLGAANAEIVGSLIAYGLLLLAPQVPSYVKALFEPKAKVPPPMAAILGGVGAGLGAGLGIARVGYEKTIGERAGIAEEAYRKWQVERMLSDDKKIKEQPPAGTWWRRLKI